MQAILEFARSHSVGHIVVGRSQRPFWRQAFGRSIPLRLAREAAGFDVHVVSLEEDAGVVKLRTKLLLAQLPLALALAVMGLLSSFITTRLGEAAAASWPTTTAACWPRSG